MRIVVSNPALHLLWTPVYFLQVFFHKNFGEQFLIKDNYKALTFAFAIPIGLLAEVEFTAYCPYAKYYFVPMAIRLLFELGRLQLNKQNNKEPHAYSMGEPMKIPWGYFIPDMKLVSRIIEPGIAMLFGILLYSTEADLITGGCLIYSGIAMFHKYRFMDGQIRKSMKDVDDRKNEH